MKVIRAIYNFIVGDMTILIGVIITMLVLALISYVGALAPLRVATGIILVVAVLVVLTASLYREIRG
ncbi:MAG TPA: hypothetical protein VKB35_02400 [Ktedonobacteraceae bacterium]|nr:hypothetical protein [Ktedonobacteraceae bacterium]